MRSKAHCARFSTADRLAQAGVPEMMKNLGSGPVPTHTGMKLARE
jgi:hypothetical protein